MKLKKGDKVLVIAGKERGQSANIVRVIGKKNMVVLDGLNLVKRHRRAGQPGKGQIIDKPMPIHASNVMIVDPKDGKRTRVTIKRGRDGARERTTVNSGQVLK
ncbi:50S ribosomal protein L24 [Candidatus Kaiserbacteria bacterium]|nr:50S ribosomal protein L24 [Candidatus Kaiserbacteria bacterium]